jgi:dTDP-4-dehydrorhamnose 3,5-epimerase
MLVRPLEIAEVRLLVPRRHADARGWLSETWRRDRLSNAGIEVEFVQENESASLAAGTIRGLHYQEAPTAQAKLVRVAAGSVFDVAVDIRPGSPTYGRWVAATLTVTNGEQLFVPHGFAHGYCTLEPNTRVIYVVDNYYSPAHERGLAFDDPSLGITWPVNSADAVLSEKDRNNPRLELRAAAQ